MRYSRMKEHTAQNDASKTSKSGTFFFILILAAALIYIAAATKAGDILSEKIIVPVVDFFSDKNAEEPAESVSNIINNQPVTENLSFPSIDEYFLQYGIFSSMENAHSAAEELIKIGGAGYIREEEGKYRVIISGYSSKDDALNVKERLANDRDMQTKLIELGSDEMNCAITCETDYAEELKLIAEEIPIYHESFLNTALELDKGNISQEEALDVLQEKKASIESTNKKLLELKEKTGDPLIIALEKYYSDLINSFETPKSELTGTALSAALKRAYIGSAYAYHELLSYDTND